MIEIINCLQRNCIWQRGNLKLMWTDLIINVSGRGPFISIWLNEFLQFAVLFALNWLAIINYLSKHHFVLSGVRDAASLLYWLITHLAVNDKFITTSRSKKDEPQFRVSKADENANTERPTRHWNQRKLWRLVALTGSESVMHTPY